MVQENDLTKETALLTKFLIKSKEQFFIHSAIRDHLGKQKRRNNHLRKGIVHSDHFAGNYIVLTEEAWKQYRCLKRMQFKIRQNEEQCQNLIVIYNKR